MAITLDGNNTSTVGVINSATAQNSTSGTSIDFTGLPSGLKRITVMFNGVSTNGSSEVQLQIGAGSVQTTGYNGTATTLTSVGTVTVALSAGFQMPTNGGSAAYVRNGAITISLLDSASGTWACTGTFGQSDSQRMSFVGGIKALSGTLDRVRITTVNGTDTFDAGSINILYE
jgi:hypothetical protein